MYNKSYGQLLIMQDKINSNRQDYDDKIKKQDSKIGKLMEMVVKIMV